MQPVASGEPIVIPNNIPCSGFSSWLHGLHRNGVWIGRHADTDSGSTLTGSNVTFTWSAGTGATAYWLDVGNAAGGNQYYRPGIWAPR